MKIASFWSRGKLNLISGSMTEMHVSKISLQFCKTEGGRPNFSRARASEYSSMISGEVVHSKSSFPAMVRIISSGFRSLNAAERTTPVSITTLIICRNGEPRLRAQFRLRSNCGFGAKIAFS